MVTNGEAVIVGQGNVDERVILNIVENFFLSLVVVNFF